MRGVYRLQPGRRPQRKPATGGGGGGGGAVAYVQSAHLGGGFGTDDVALGALTSGSTLVFAASTREAPTISDTGGHTWTNRLSLGPLSSGTLFNIWTAPNSSTSATTITPNASSYYTLIAYEITGATYASVTGANRDTGLAASPAGGPTTAMVGDNGMGIFFICEDGEENLSSVTPTARSNQTHAWPKFAYAFGEVELDNGATLSASATASGTFPGWHVGLITFSAT